MIPTSYDSWPCPGKVVNLKRMAKWQTQACWTLNSAFSMLIKSSSNFYDNGRAYKHLGFPPVSWCSDGENSIIWYNHRLGERNSQQSNVRNLLLH